MTSYRRNKKTEKTLTKRRKVRNVIFGFLTSNMFLVMAALIFIIIDARRIDVDFLGVGNILSFFQATFVIITGGGFLFSPKWRFLGLGMIQGAVFFIILLII